MAAPLDEAYRLCAETVRAQDVDRWLACLFAPEPARRHLFALYAFNAEVARVRGAVREPLAGEMRLRWWADCLAGRPHGDAEAHPVARALLATKAAKKLPAAPLIGLVEARMFDLYDDPMPTLRDLDGYCGETASVLFRLAQIVLADGVPAGDATAAGKAGIAWAVTGLLRALPWHAARGQLYLPKDLLDRNGVTRADVVGGTGGPGLAAACAELRAHAREALAVAREAARALPSGERLALLPLALVEPYLRAMERAGVDPLRSAVDIPKWRKIWRMLRWRRTG